MVVNILGVAVIILVIGVLWIYKSSKKQLVTACDELKFLNKKKNIMMKQCWYCLTTMISYLLINQQKHSFL